MEAVAAFGINSLARSLDPLKGYFNDGKGKLRFLALVSPT
jgi:hypothetical protein